MLSQVVLNSFMNRLHPARDLRGHQLMTGPGIWQQSLKRQRLRNSYMRRAWLRSALKRVTKDDAEVVILYDIASLYTKVPRHQARKVTTQRLGGHTNSGRLNISYPTKCYRQYKVLEPKHIQNSVQRQQC